MPARRPFPVPKKRINSRAWEVYWYWDKERYYVMVPGLSQKDEIPAEMERLQIAAALASANPVFPDKYANAPGVIKYLNDWNQDDAPCIQEPPEHWLESYRKSLFQHCRGEWARNSMSYLTRLQARAGGNMVKVTRPLASSFLDDVQNGNTAATRNRALAACNRFFKWLMSTGRARHNLFSGIKQLKEVRTSEIVYCTRDERARLIKAAKSCRPHDWLAVVVAFFTGCRRGEIFRMEWEDVSLDNRKIQIRETKTGVPRTVPISKALLNELVKARKDFGPVVPRLPGETWENQADGIIDELREVLAEPAAPGADGHAQGRKGKRQFIMSEKEKHAVVAAREKAEGEGKLRKLFPFDAPELAWDGLAWLPGERIGWNTWRHTFGSLLAQDGVSLDKISAWMGNTPEVCRRHYTQFMPRDKHDDEIDLL